MKTKSSGHQTHTQPFQRSLRPIRLNKHKQKTQQACVSSARKTANLIHTSGQRLGDASSFHKNVPVQIYVKDLVRSPRNRPPANSLMLAFSKKLGNVRRSLFCEYKDFHSQTFQDGLKCLKKLPRRGLCPRTPVLVGLKASEMSAFGPPQGCAFGSLWGNNIN
jgi:hypothetical protein